MHGELDRLIGAYEAGNISRRKLLRQLSAITALGTVASAAAESASTPQDAGATFQAVSLNHIALSVTDIPRSRDFYVRHLGLTVTRESASSCFLDCGPHGSIPARAGEPSTDPAETPPPGVYPRTCGGTRSLSLFDGPPSGLSPHVRGNLSFRRPELILSWSIPARAGELGLPRFPGHLWKPDKGLGGEAWGHDGGTVASSRLRQ